MTWLLTAAAGRTQRGNSWGGITASAQIVVLLLKPGQFFYKIQKVKRRE